MFGTTTVPIRLWIIGLAFSATLAGALAAPSSAQISWLNFEDGDILNVSTATGTRPGYIRLNADRGTELSDSRGTVLIHRFKFGYGLTRNFVLGGSTKHMQQSLTPTEFKNGLGDSNVFLKAFFQPVPTVPIHLGMRHSLSLPTGFDQEQAGLVPFTSGTNDYSGQILITYRSPKLGIHLNPGVIIPGADHPSYLTAGLGLELDRFIPMGINVAGEYFTRWNMVDERFESDVYLNANRDLFWGIGVDFGIKRRLLDTANSGAEMRLGFSVGTLHDEAADLRQMPPPKYPPVTLLIYPVETRFPDPNGIANLVNGQFRIAGFRQSDGVPVQIKTTTDPNHILGSRHYALRIRILDLNEGDIVGTRIPMLLSAPKAKTELVAEAELLAPNGLPLGRKTQFEAVKEQGLGSWLAPMTTTFEKLIVPDEVKESLRKKTANELAEQIIETVVPVIGEREAK